MIRRLNSLIVLIAIIFASSSFAAEISIGRIDNAKSGQRRTVTISADSIANQISGFNLLIAYDQSLSYVFDIRPGEFHKNYGWEYFNYRLITRDTLSAHMPGFNVHLINIIGLASLSGAPPPSLNAGIVVLAELEVRLGIVIGSFSDETWVPFSFFWRDCNDNVLTSLSGDTLYTASQLYENKSSFTPRDSVSFAFPGFGIPNDPCPPPNGTAMVNNVDYVNAGIWSFVIDPAEECFAGDVDLNGIPYEIADIVAFINFFTFGIPGLCGEFPTSICLAALEQTNCDCDGTIVTVSDLVCFIRKVIGEVRFSKIPVFLESNQSILIEQIGNSKTVSFSTDAEVALVYLRVNPKQQRAFKLNDFGFEQSLLRTGQIGDTLTMLLVDLKGNPVLAAGEHLLFEYTGNSEFEIQAWVIDMNGQETALKLESGILPTSPELLQNYPNPFNPSTTIEFSLPTKTDWKLEIYNVAGQLIKDYYGTASGATMLEWDGTNTANAEVASGVYFYKLISHDVTLSRKMLLLK